ncbi:MAG: peptidylprolyl isomerase [Bacilli bacterium]
MNKKRTIIKSFLAITLILILSYNNLGAKTALANANDEFIKINGKSIKEEAVINSITLNGEYQSALAIIDNKALASKYAKDERLSKLIAKQEEDFKSQYPTEALQLTQYQVYGVDNYQDYFNKIDGTLALYRELASIDATYDYLFDEKVHKEVYDKRISGKIKIKRILVSPITSIQESYDPIKLEKAESKALIQAEEAAQAINKGEDYEKVYQKYSSDLSSNLGVIGEYTIDEAIAASLNNEIIDAAFSLKEKQASKPIKTANGYEVVVIEVIEEKIAYDKATSLIKDKLYEIVKAQNTNLSKYALLVYRDKHKIEFNNNNYSKMYANEYIQARKAYIENTSSNNFGF